MENSFGLIINYTPEENAARFQMTNGQGLRTDLDDSATLKEYENKPGLFTLEGQKSHILDYLYNYFDGEDTVSLQINVSDSGYSKRKEEFRRLEETIRLQNKEHKMQIALDIRKEPDKLSSSTAVSTNHPATGVRKPKKIALIGKAGCGKSTLVYGMSEFLHSAVRSQQLTGGYTLYVDNQNAIEWYEINGIDLGKENFLKAEVTLNDLLNKGITDTIYCFYSMTGKMEDMERDYIVKLKDNHPSLNIIAVITRCMSPEAADDFSSLVSKATLNTKVFPILARRLKTKAGFREPFGMEALAAELGVKHE